MGFKFNPTTGQLDISKDKNNFSITRVPQGQTKVIPENQEMVVTQDVMVQGDLMVRGLVTQLTDFTDFSFFWTRIPESKSIRVPEGRLMLYRSPLMVEGNLMVAGLLVGV